MKKLLFVLFLAVSPAWSQTADTILINGKILTGDQQFSTQEAIAVAGGRILAVGKTGDMRRLGSANSRVIDLQGRTVIPGLIDSHLHGIRAALSFATEVNWIGASSLDDALGRITQSARSMKPGSWLIVAGGWNVQQLKEKRVPTQAELTAAAPNNPVYLNNLGFSLFLREHFKEAIREYEKAARIAPLSHRVRTNMGYAYAALGDLPSAAREFRMGGSEVDATNNLGFAYERRGDMANAYDLYLQAVRIDPTAVRPRSNLVHAAVVLGRPIPAEVAAAPAASSPSSSSPSSPALSKEPVANP